MTLCGSMAKASISAAIRSPGTWRESKLKPSASKITPCSAPSMNSRTSFKFVIQIERTAGSLQSDRLTDLWQRVQFLLYLQSAHVDERLLRQKAGRVQYRVAVDQEATQVGNHLVGTGTHCVSGPEFAFIICEIRTLDSGESAWLL